MKSILFIHQSAELYGSDKTLLMLLKHLDKSKFSPLVILPNEGQLKKELEKENIKVVVAPVLKLYRKMFTPRNIYKFILEIRSGLKILDQLNKEYKFDLVYSNTLAVLLGMIFARKRKIKHLWHVHEIIQRPKTISIIFPKLLFRYSDLVVCNSEATKQNLIEKTPELEVKITVVHNGIEAVFFKDSDFCKVNFGFSVSDIIITLVGRISSWKGHQLLLDSFLVLSKTHDNVKLIFLGSAPDNQEHFEIMLKENIHKYQLQDKVIILPFKKNVLQFWNSIDIAVVPSTEPEPFGMVAIEAMLARKPVIASNHGGLTEIVINNETGFLIEPNNVEALSEALTKLIGNPQLRNEFGEKGYQRAINEFSSKKYVESLEQLF